MSGSSGSAALPVIDVGPLVGGAPAAARAAVAEQIQVACRERGFFDVTGHGVPAGLLAELADASTEFFALPAADKLEIAMERGGRAWRGFFPVGAELTSGEPDLKEGLSPAATATISSGRFQRFSRSSAATCWDSRTGRSARARVRGR